MASIPLEDSYADILGKAMRGTGHGVEQIASRVGVPSQYVEALLGGNVGGETLRKVAPVLGLDPTALEALARGSYRPQPVELAGLAQFNTPYEDMTVNAYLAYDSASGSAIAFDTGADASAMLALLEERGLKLELILLTHTHGDRIFDLDRLVSKTGAEAWVGEREPLEGASSFAAGRHWGAGALRVESRLTWGHSRGGITYVVHGLARPVAIVGDSIFAGSMGGGGISYTDAVRNNREQILTLPEQTILCPGHGPMTTVGEEKRNNPFFAGNEK